MSDDGELSCCVYKKGYVFVGVHVFVICVYTGMHVERYAYVCAHIGVCVCSGMCA